MGIVFTETDIRNTVESFGYIFIRQYLHRNYRVVVIKDSNGYMYEIDYYSFRKRISPAPFHRMNPFTINNISVWLKKNKKTFSVCLDVEYINCDIEKLKFYCSVCKNNFYATWSTIYNQNTGCRICSNRNIIETNSLHYLFPEISKELSPKNSFSSKEIGAKCGKIAIWKCSGCGNEWKARVIKRTMRGDSCPKCSSSFGEKRISKWLDEKNIKYIPEHRFEGCFDKKKLPFDFYLPLQNISIEYQGQQHYFPIDFSSKGKEWAEKQLEDIKKRDKIKKRYCKKNGIKLITIKYTKFDKIEEILEKELVRL